MLVRKLAKVLRGTATPFQLIAACLIGAALGFVPGFVQAPGLILFWLAVLLVLNANLAVAGLVALGAKALSFALLPVSFAVGRVLLDGPTEGLFAAAVNAPVVAWFGLEYYAVTGGQLVGLVLGLVVGVALVKVVIAYRRKMADLGENSEKFKKYSSKKSVKFLTWLLIGKGAGKKTYAEVLEAKANPIRIIGVVAAVLMVAFVFVLAQFASEPLVTAGLQRGLEQANGATVDLRAARLDLGENKLELEGLAMADPADLGADILRADRLTADLAGMDLLRKRLTLDLLTADDASSGEERRVRGVLIGSRPEPGPPDEDAEGKTIDDYMADAEKWRERLAQLRRWLEKVGGGEDDDPQQRAESRDERVARQVRDLGYARVRAEHLIQGAPTLLVRQMNLRTITTPDAPDEVFDIEGENVSTHPELVEEPSSVRVTSRSGKYAVDLGLDASSGAGTARLTLRDMDVDRFTAQLGSAAPVSGGTFDVSADGSISLAGRPTLNLPMDVTLKNTNVTVPGSSPTAVESFTLPMGVTGPVDNPSIAISDGAMRQALIDAGRGELADRFGEEAGKLLEDSGVEVPEEAEGAVDEVKDRIGNLLGGGKKDDGG